MRAAERADKPSVRLAAHPARTRSSEGHEASSWRQMAEKSPKTVKAIKYSIMALLFLYLPLSRVAFQVSARARAKGARSSRVCGSGGSAECKLAALTRPPHTDVTRCSQIFTCDQDLLESIDGLSGFSCNANTGCKCSDWDLFPVFIVRGGNANGRTVVCASTTRSHAHTHAHTRAHRASAS